MTRPWELIHGVGIGDFFGAESYWSPEARASLRTIHHAWPDSPATLALMGALFACQDLAHVEHRALSYPTERIPGAIETLRDQAIFHRLEFRGSSFLTNNLDCDVPDGLHRRYAYICPSTPKNGPRCDRWIRDEEWPSVIDRLEVLDLAGLVLNTEGGKSRVPDHPRLIDWTGRTSLPESIEVLKRAWCYIGVDSCMAILAAQLFPPDRLAIRTNNPYLIDRPEVHYPPQTSFGFLFSRLDGEPFPALRPDRPDGVVIETRANVLMGNRSFGYGCRIEVDAEKASGLIAAGKAIRVEDLDSR